LVLNVGDSAPDFELADTDLIMRKLSEFLDKKVVLSFIVAASSPVCETELCTFRDSWNDISNLGAHIVAISNDGPFANKAFAENISQNIKQNWISKGIPPSLKTKIKPTVAGIIKSLTNLTQELNKKNYGLLIVVDEMGKYLEHASSVGSDLNLFQEIAENFSNLKF